MAIGGVPLSKKKIVIPVVASIFFLAFVILSVYTYSNASKSGNKISESGNRTVFYGCTNYGDLNLIHCDPVTNNLAGYIVPSHSSLIYTNRGQPVYDSGNGQTGLQLDAKRMEALELPISFRPDQRNFSISLWIKQAKNPQQYGVIVSHANSNGTAGWSLDGHSKSTQSVTFSVFNKEGQEFMSHSAPISNRTYTQVVATFDGSSIKIFENGRLLGSTAFKGKYISDPNIPLRIGSSAFCLTCNWWSGTIKDLRVYNRPISETEIKEIFTNDLPSIVTKGLVGYWTFDGNLNDISGNGNQGVINSMIASMASAPDGRLFFTEKDSGRIMIMKDDKVLPKPFVVLTDYYVNWEQGFLGLTIDPKFEENHFVYLYYTAMDNKTGQPHVFNRLVRFTDNNNQSTNMVVLIDRIPASIGYHSGGALAFGPDDKLYVGVGDAAQHEFAQDPGIVIGKVLRINRDGTIPQDNPFPNSPVYTIGHRNIFGLAFDKQDGDGIIAEAGDYHYDKINLIQKGGNYGFPNLLHPNSPSPNSWWLTNNSAIKPLISYWESITPTQAIYYTGDKIPQFKNKFLFGTFNGDIYALTLDLHDKRVVLQEHTALKHYPFEPVVFIAQTPSGDIYYGNYNIYKLTSVDVKSGKQDLFPVEIKSSSNVGIKDIQISNIQGGRVANIQTFDNNSKFSSSPGFIQVSMPSAIIPDISSVSGTSINKDEQPSTKTVDFRLNSNSSSSANAVINISLGSGIHYHQLSIIGLIPGINVTNTQSANSTYHTSTVSIVRYASDSGTPEPFKPSSLAVTTGTKVSWINNDSVPHTVTEGIPGGSPSASKFNSGIIGPGQIFQHIFSQAGTVRYYCTLHPFMSGEVLVK